MDPIHHLPLLAVILSILTFSVSLTSAYDPNMLQDICVADLQSELRLNGFACLPMENVTADHFHSDSLAMAGDTDNKFGSKVTAAAVTVFPGLNTLGVSMARIDYAAGGLNPPHTHPRATELIYVTKGSLVVGFITTGDILFEKFIKLGDMFVFPRGLVHFQWNNGTTEASVMSAFDSQFPGTQKIGNSLFASSPEISNAILAKSFHTKVRVIADIKKEFM